ncbi:MliC family protein [Pseudoalteromonas sp. K222D]|uniref:MliC family protein n=1 Tax=Pseudoalteromonas sp. K222D TaxID=2820756 RepID=UPI001AD61BE9|nr:MliC family protein [Pseudoalteromonas sp. K222D]MBO7925199.1 MliC family protein [Pseudoalteromonas sp. K222D]
MKIFAPAIIITTLMLSACGNEPQDNSHTDVKNTAQTAVIVHNYQCESGNTMAVTYPSTDTATVDYLGTEYEMKIAVSASGARYINDKYEFWTKASGTGSEGTLFSHMQDGSTGDAIETCTAL